MKAKVLQRGDYLLRLELGADRKVTRATLIEPGGSHEMRLQANNCSTVPALVKGYLASKRLQNLSKVYTDGLAQRCDQFASDFTGRIEDVTDDEVRSWLCGLVHGRTGLPLGPVSRNHYRAAVLGLANYARRTKAVSREWSVDLPVIKAPREQVQIWTPGEMRLLLDGAERLRESKRIEFDLVPYLAIAGFAGPRQAEMMRLAWERNVRRATKGTEATQGRIVIGAEIAKTARGRVVPMQDNLAKWLVAYEGCKGPVCRYADPTAPLLKVARSVGLRWRHNALRHSFITYRVCATRNIAATALEAGNSVGEIHDHYLDFEVEDRAAKEWFEIIPERGQKILELKFG